MSLEMLFGAPQVWSPPIAPGGRLLGSLMPPNVIQSIQSPQPFHAGLQAGVVNPPPIAEPAGGVTAASLLAAVAVRRGQPLGPTSDQEIEEFIGDALDVLPGSSDIEVRCDGGRATLTGQVSHKRLKRDAGEIAWAIPSVNDVQNNVTIVPRRRSRPIREAEAPVVAGRKQA